MLSLSLIHSKGIVHRDLKPENIIFDDLGYARLTDFSISKYIKEKINDTTGTPSYMSPEALFGKNQTYMSDFYNIGVIAYELIYRERPYLSMKREELKNEILSRQAYISLEDFNGKYSEYCINFINRLLIKNPTKRLGYINEIEDLVNDYWMRDVDWKAIYNKKIYSPFNDIINSAKRKFKVTEIYDDDDISEEDFVDYNDFIKYNNISKKRDYTVIFNNYDSFCFLNNNNFKNNNISYEKVSYNIPELSKKSKSLKNILLGYENKIIKNIKNIRNYIICKIPEEMYDDEENILKFFYTPTIRKFSRIDEKNENNYDNNNNYSIFYKPNIHYSSDKSILRKIKNFKEPNKYKSKVIFGNTFMKYSNRDNMININQERKDRSVEKNINDYFKDRLFVPINEYPFEKKKGIDLLNFKKIPLKKSLLNETLSSFIGTKTINGKRKIRFDSLNNSKPINNSNDTSNELPNLSMSPNQKKIKLKLKKKKSIKLLPKIKIKKSQKKTSN